MKKMTIVIITMLMAGMAGCGNLDGTEAAADSLGESSPAQQTEQESQEDVEAGSPQQTTRSADETANSEEEDKSMKISVKSSDYEIIYELNNSQAATELYAQLPLSTEVEPFGNNEMTFYPPEKLNTSNTPYSGGEAGSLSYYEPWGDVVLFYAPCNPNNSLYGLGTVISGMEDIEKLNGTISISAYEE